MQFCKDCGGVLNLFGKDERELCPVCIQNQRVAPPAPAAPSEEKDGDLLRDTVLSFENGKIVLRSKEGWELWSGPPGVRTELKTIFAQARRIYRIRLRRQRN
ncbi:MAG: hypothetical protein KJ630_20705 [Proteobacteria bacterium]|nr:hypothetical protein [Pseudomonadota bacterium]